MIPAEFDPLPPVHLLTRLDDLHTLVEHLLSQAWVAIDTESNNIYAYQNRVCLLQISTETADYIIDPLVGLDLTRLGEVTANPRIEKIFHAADHDIAFLRRDYGFEFQNLFDTMYAARLLGIRKASLVNLVKTYFGVKLDKRWQRADWGKRPLTAQQVEYARLDTRFLGALRDIFYQELAAQGRLQEALERFAELAFLPPAENPFNPQGFWNISAARDLTPRQLATLKAIYLWREDVASQSNLPSFRILSNEDMLKLAQEDPLNMKQLHHLGQLQGWVLRNHGQKLLIALAKARHAKPPKRPKTHQTLPSGVAQRHERLMEWRKARALELGVESDLIISRETLWEIAKADPHSVADLQNIHYLGAWRLAHYGDEIMRVLSDDR